jgi:hypothetical protein
MILMHNCEYCLSPDCTKSALGQDWIPNDLYNRPFSPAEYDLVLDRKTAIFQVCKYGT